MVELEALDPDLIPPSPAQVLDEWISADSDRSCSIYHSGQGGWIVTLSEPGADAGRSCSIYHSGQGGWIVTLSEPEPQAQPNSYRLTSVRETAIGESGDQPVGLSATIFVALSKAGAYDHAGRAEIGRVMALPAGG